MRFGIRTLLVLTAVIAVFIQTRHVVQRAMVNLGLLPNYRTLTNRSFNVDGERLFEFHDMAGLPSHVSLAFDDKGAVSLLWFDPKSPTNLLEGRTIGIYQTVALADFTGDGKLELLFTNADFPDRLGHVVRLALNYDYVLGENHSEPLNVDVPKTWHAREVVIRLEDVAEFKPRLSQPKLKPMDIRRPMPVTRLLDDTSCLIEVLGPFGWSFYTTSAWVDLFGSGQPVSCSLWLDRTDAGPKEDSFSRYYRHSLAYRVLQPDGTFRSPTPIGRAMELTSERRLAYEDLDGLLKDGHRTFLILEEE